MQSQHSPADRTPITVIGLGRMGAAIAEVFLDRGHPVTVWNRSAAKSEPLESRGAKPAGSPTEAVAASPVTVICVVDTDVARTALEPTAAALSGKTVINLSSGRPDQARGLAEWAAGHDATVLDGAILGVPQTIATPDTMIIYSGDAEAHRTHHELLSSLGTARYLGSDPGLAALNDVAVLSGMYGMFAGFFQAAALVDTEGISVREFTDAVLVPWLAALMPALPALADEIDSGEYPVNFSDLAANAVGLANIQTATRSQGVDPQLLEPLRILLDREQAAGNGESSFTRVFEGIKRRRP